MIDYDKPIFKLLTCYTADKSHEIENILRRNGIQVIMLNGSINDIECIWRGNDVEKFNKNTLESLVKSMKELIGDCDYNFSSKFSQILIDHNINEILK